MTEIQGTYRLRELDNEDVFDREIIVLRRADDHNGKGVHWHAAGDLWGYGWMSLEFLRKQYVRN